MWVCGCVGVWVNLTFLLLAEFGFETTKHTKNIHRFHRFTQIVLQRWVVDIMCSSFSVRSRIYMQHMIYNASYDSISRARAAHRAATTTC